MKNRIEEFKYLTKDLSFSTSNYLIENYLFEYLSKNKIFSNIKCIGILDFGEKRSLYYHCECCKGYFELIEIDKMIPINYRE